MPSIAASLPTPFRQIITDVMATFPNSVGGAFVAGDGETVDWVSTMNALDWQIFAAQFGIILRTTQDAIRTFHWGECEVLSIGYSTTDVFMRTLTEGYFLLLAVKPPANLIEVTAMLDMAALRVREEMGF